MCIRDSPDGGVELNTGLAENRQNNTAKVINKDLKKSKIEAAVDTKYTAQDYTEGIPTNAEVVFLGKSATLKVSDQLAGRLFNAFVDPIDGGPEIEGHEVPIGGPSVNPVRRKQPSELIATGIAGIDLNNTLVSGQKTVSYTHLILHWQ